VTREEVLAALESQWSAAEARLRPTSEERWGTWTPKDLLCHLAGWELGAAKDLRERRHGRVPSDRELLWREVDDVEWAGLENLDTDGYNAWLEKEFAQLDWEQAEALALDAHEGLRVEVEALTDEQLAAPYNERAQLWRRIGVDSFLHYQEHLG
jgi:tRNA A37 N6-isopentenylltransferase MiaA